MRATVLAVIAVLSSVSAAAAGETAWQEVAPEVRLRLVSSDVVTAGGTTWVGLEVDMPPGYKTYWRVPGETGIPTEIAIDGSEGVAAADIEWPMPVIDAGQGFLDYVYFGSVVLPVEVSVTGEAAQLEAQVRMGICSDICVPATATFSLPLDFASPDRASGLRIAQAVAEAPIPWTENQPPVGDAWIAADGKSIAVRLDPSVVDPATLIATAAVDGALFGAPQKSPEPDVIVVPFLGGASLAGLAGHELELTFMTALGAYTVNRRLAAGQE